MAINKNGEAEIRRQGDRHKNSPLRHAAERGDDPDGLAREKENKGIKTTNETFFSSYHDYSFNVNIAPRKYHKLTPLAAVYVFITPREY